MKSNRRVVVLASSAGLLLVVLGLVGLGCAGSSNPDGSGDPNNPNDPNNTQTGNFDDPSINFKLEPGYTSLFKSKQLNGWQFDKNKDDLEGLSETPDRRFFVTGGVLTAAPKDRNGKRGVKEIWTGKDFSKDFVIRLDYKAAQEATGALVIRNASIPIGDYIRRNEQKHMKKFKTDGWNEIEVVVKLVVHANRQRLSEGDTLEVTYNDGKAQPILNGKSIDPNAISVSVIATPKCNGEALENRSGSRSHYGVRSSGRVGLRAVSGKIQYANIRFRELN